MTFPWPCVYEESRRDFDELVRNVCGVSRSLSRSQIRHRPKGGFSDVSTNTTWIRVNRSLVPETARHSHPIIVCNSRRICTRAVDSGSCFCDSFQGPGNAERNSCGEGPSSSRPFWLRNTQQCFAEVMMAHNLLTRGCHSHGSIAAAG